LWQARAGEPLWQVQERQSSEIVLYAPNLLNAEHKQDRRQQEEEFCIPTRPRNRWHEVAQ